MPSPAVMPGSSSKGTPANRAEEATPTGEQHHASGLHVGLSAYGTGSTGQRSTPWSAASHQPQDYSMPQFHEMEVSFDLLLDADCSLQHFIYASLHQTPS